MTQRVIHPALVALLVGTASDCSQLSPSEARIRHDILFNKLVTPILEEAMSEPRNLPLTFTIHDVFRCRLWFLTTQDAPAQLADWFDNWQEGNSAISSMPWPLK